MGRSVSMKSLSTLGVAEEAPGGLCCLMDRLGGIERGREGRESGVYLSLKGAGLVSIFQTMPQDSVDFRFLSSLNEVVLSWETRSHVAPNAFYLISFYQSGLNG